MINPKFNPLLKTIMVKDKLTGETLSVHDLVLRRYEQMKTSFMLTPLQLTAKTHKFENIAKISINYGTQDNPVSKDYYIGGIFDPFVGPLSGYSIKEDEYGKAVSIPTGQRLSHDDLWSMQWFLDYVEFLSGPG